MPKKEKSNSQIVLRGVRLSFPNLFAPRAFSGSDGKAGGSSTDVPKFSCALILDKEEHANEIKAIKTGIRTLVAEHFKGNAKVLKGVCLREGEEKVDDEGEYKDGYGPDVMFVNASNSKRPQVVDRDKTPLTAEDNRPYAGCYVNAVINLWAQNNNYGKRINAGLLAVQFSRDGEPFGEAAVNVDEVFDDESDEEGDGEEEGLF